MNEPQSEPIYTNPSCDKRIIACVVFSLIACIGYVACDLYKLPLFTYYPAVNEFVMGFAKMTESQGPAMYWYGWLCTTTILGLIVSACASLIKVSYGASKFLAHTTWITVWALLPVLFNSLNFYWTHA